MGNENVIQVAVRGNWSDLYFEVSEDDCVVDMRIVYNMLYRG